MLGVSTVQPSQHLHHYQALYILRCIEAPFSISYIIFAINIFIVWEGQRHTFLQYPLTTHVLSKHNTLRYKLSFQYPFVALVAVVHPPNGNLEHQINRLKLQHYHQLALIHELVPLSAGRFHATSSPLLCRTNVSSNS